MLLYAVGGLVFFPCDAPDSEGGVCVGLQLIAQCDAAAPCSPETLGGYGLVVIGVGGQDLRVGQGQAGD